MIKLIIKILYFNIILKFYLRFKFLFFNNFFVHKNIVKEIKLLKKTDIIYIFGSGNSINLLKDSHIRNIFNYDTFGFNHAYYSSLPFKFYAFEFLESSEFLKNVKKFNEIYSKNIKKYLLNNSSLNYVIIKDPRMRNINLYKEWLDIKKNFFFHHFIDIPAVNIKQINNYFKKISYFDKKFSFFNEFRYLHRKRSSLIAYIDLFRRAGYKQINLVGVDLVNSDYFFKTNDFNYPKIYIDLPQSQPEKNIHKTQNKKYGELIFSEILNAYLSNYKIKIENQKYKK